MRESDVDKHRPQESPDPSTAAVSRGQGDLPNHSKSPFALTEAGGIIGSDLSWKATKIPRQGLFFALRRQRTKRVSKAPGRSSLDLGRRSSIRGQRREGASSQTSRRQVPSDKIFVRATPRQAGGEKTGFDCPYGFPEKSGNHRHRLVFSPKASAFAGIFAKAPVDPKTRDPPASNPGFGKPRS